jgi:hypothetical protein
VVASWWHSAPPTRDIHVATATRAVLFQQDPKEKDRESPRRKTMHNITQDSNDIFYAKALEIDTDWCCRTVLDIGAG